MGSHISNNVRSSFVAQATRANPLDLINQHLSKNPDYKVIDTKFPSLRPLSAADFNVENLNPSPYVMGLKFIVREEDGKITPKMYYEIRKEEKNTNTQRSEKANIVGIIDGSSAYGIEDISGLPFVGQSNQATLNAHAENITDLFNDPNNGKSTLQGAELKKLN